MTKHEITAIFIVAVTVLVAAYDIFVELAWGEPNTISQVFRDWAVAFPLTKPLVLATMIVIFWHLFLEKY